VIIGLTMGLVGVIVTTVAGAVGVPIEIAQAVPLGNLVADPDRVWIVAVWAVTAAALVASLWVESASGPLAQRFLVLSAAAGAGLGLVLLAWRNQSYGDLWVGFGPLRSALSVVVAIVGLAVLLRSIRGIRFLAVLTSTVLALVTIVYLLESPETFVVSNDNGFTFEEMLAPSSGRMPGFDYINQYSTLLGYPLALAAGVARDVFNQSPSWFAVIWLIILQFVTLFVAVATVIRLAPRRIAWLMPAIVIPVAFLVGADGLLYYANLPLRFFLPTVLLAAIGWFGVRHAASSRPWWVPVTIGVLGGACAFNNLDYGVPAFLAGGVVVIARSLVWRESFRAGLLYLAGSAAIPVVVVLAGALTGRQLHPGYLLFFVRSFGIDGLMNERMPTIGLHAAFVFLGIVGAVVGVLGARATSRKISARHQALLFQSVWMLLSLIYFSGRSLTPTLVNGTAFLASVNVALLLSVGFSHLVLLRRVPFRERSLADWIATVAIVALAAAPVAAWTYFPSVETQTEKYKRALDPRDDALVYLEPDPRPPLALVPGDRSLIGVISVSGSTWQPRTGVRNASLFLHPNYLALPTGAELQCDYLRSLSGEILLTTDNQLAILGRSEICKYDFDFTTTTRVAHDPIFDVEWVTVARRSG
jgi:hypothetical protein